MGGRFHHVGLVVADLDRSLRFYRDLLRLEPLGAGAESDPRYAEMLGVPRASFAWAELDLGDGRVLELLRFDEPSPGPSPAAATAAEPTTPGSSHVGIRVDDLDATYDALVEEQVAVVSRPIGLVEQNAWLGARAFYARDPDGHLVELVQSPDPPTP